MLLGMIVTLLEHLGMGLLGQFFQTTAETAQSAGIDSKALDYIYQLVESAEKDTALADGSAKYDWVYAQAVLYFSKNGMDLAITFVESLIQLAVHHQHASTGASGSTVSQVVAQVNPKPAPSSAKP